MTPREVVFNTLEFTGPGRIARQVWLLPWSQNHYKVHVSSDYIDIGVVFGTIVQSMRRIMSILFGTLIAYIGFEHLETMTSKAILVRRLSAALLLSVAITLFGLSQHSSYKISIQNSGFPEASISNSPQ